MIHDLFEILADDMNRFLKSKHNITEDKVIPSNIMTPDGSVGLLEPDKIIMTLAGVEVDRSQTQTTTYKKTYKGKFVKDFPPVNLNLNIVFSSYFSNENYLEGLKFLSSVVAYFQCNANNFTPQVIPALNGVIDRFTTELVNYDTKDLGNVWSLLGAKYMPSVMYRVKSLPIKYVKPTPSIPVIVKT